MNLGRYCGRLADGAPNTLFAASFGTVRAASTARYRGREHDVPESLMMQGRSVAGPDNKRAGGPARRAIGVQNLRTRWAQNNRTAFPKIKIK